MIWTKSDIRLARKVDLVPILTDRNYRLCPIGNGNFRILPALSTAEGPDPDAPNAPACPAVSAVAFGRRREPRRGAGVTVKKSFWIWPEKNISGNAIDFFTQVEGQTFNQAMEIITAAYPPETAAANYDALEHNIREERGNVAKFVR
jgi:hypothetical protein